jgi:amino acid adenylation domain-containing protein
MTAVDASGTSEARRALLEQRVRAAASRSATEPRRVTPRSRPNLVPLSASQTPLWYHSQLVPDSCAYNEVSVIHKTGALDVDAVRGAINEVIARHEAWRTTFITIDGVPHQHVHERVVIDVPFVDLSHLSRENADRRATEIAAADARRPYDLERGPLIRPHLIRITDDEHRLYLGLHHLIFDGVTLHQIVFPEFIALYRSYATGKELSLPEPEAQYRDFAIWQQDWVSGPVAAARIARWRNRLAGITAAPLPLDHPPPSQQRFSGGTIPVTVAATTVEGLRSAARQARGTLFHALAAAYAWWLHLYAESTEVVFGTPCDLRHRTDLFNVAGYCITPVVVRCDVSGQETFTATVDRIRDVVADALSDAVPFDTLVAELGVPRDPRNNPLFQTLMLLEPLQTSPADDWSLHQMETDVRDIVGSTKFDISIELDERPEGHLAGRFFFSTDLFDRETAIEMARHWERLLDSVATAPGIPMGEHDLVTADERQRQLSWNPAAPESLSPQCVHDIIRAQTERTPDSVAVQVGDEALTYRQLDDRAEDIAARLLATGAGPGTVVAVLLDRTPDLVAAIIGILKSGAAFLPLDPRQAAARNNFSINDAGATIIVTDRQPPDGGEPVTASVINLGDLGPHAPRQGPRPTTVSSADLAYVIYTSGSTGRPKGVLVEHRGLVNLALTMFREFGVSASDTVVSPSSISFDIALGDIFCALACGARLVLATFEEATNPDALSRLIARTSPTYMMTTPTLWGALVAAGWNGDPHLTAATIGETLTDSLAEMLLQRCPAVWNTYGPTEATVITTVARLAAGDTVTVGTPLPNVRVYVVDSRGRMQPVGVPGEIAIGGVAVARGYLNRPEEQAHRFLDDPYRAGGRIYRTGDRGRFLPDGRLQHLGRYDDQVKIRGIRVEPGEIASILAEHPQVGSCAVVAREAPGGGPQLVAYIVGEPGCPNEREARDWLRQRLPEYMVPSAFVHLSALPTTASRKLDKAALPAPSPVRTTQPGDRRPRNDMERRIAQIWTDLLGVPVTDINSDFFDIGGHSMLAARLISKIRRTFGAPLPLSTFVDSGRTIADLAELLGAESPSRTDEVTSGPPLHFIFADLASAMSLRHFTAQWGAAQPVHTLIPEQPGGRFDRSLSIERRATQALSTIRERQPDGPLALIGYSIGGLLAYEVVRQAVDAGQQVDWLGILDTPAPGSSAAQLLGAQMTVRWRLRQLRQQPARVRWAKYAEVARRVVRSGALWPQDDFDYRGAAEIACRYQQPGHEVPMDLFVSEGSAAYMEAELLGWDEVHKGTLTVHRLGGDHATLLELPDVEQLARMMLESLRKARASAETSGAAVELANAERQSGLA